ncbi:hypothetical protein [Flavobacterium sp. GSP14]|uniref:hypothetical protein n=1 Tax=Flavobacterium sp. GSP14 TaxID=3401734 RepID=UPI003AAFEFDB
MILPKNEFNIYSKTEENLNAVLSYHFDKYLLFDKNEAVEDLLKDNTLSMSQIEFIEKNFLNLGVSYLKTFSEKKQHHIPT